jgi:hypothetical protein
MAPFGVLMMFSGLMSRWITPPMCAAASALASWAPIVTTCAMGSGPDPSSARSGSPGTNSYARYKESPISSSA